MMTEEIYELYKQHPHVTIDSRAISKGSIFFGIRGDRFDGNQFASEALRKGAAYAIVDKVTEVEAGNMADRVIKVDDTIAALQALASHHRSKLAIPVLGITGSNGKTTTKELIHAVLRQKFQTFATKGNLNNHLGLPLSILQIHNEHEIAVLEFGANHQGEHELLCNIAQPTHGLITNIGKDHLEGYGGMDGVKKAHQEFTDYLENKGCLFFQNKTDPIVRELAENLYRVSFGPEDQSGQADFRAKISHHFPTLTLEVTKTLNNGDAGFTVETNLYGSYNFYNILCALCIGQYFGVPQAQMKDAIGNYHPHSNRSEVIDWGGATVILDAYNANPSSMLAAIQEFARIDSPKKMSILGDMYELGEYSEKEHQTIVNILKGNNWTKVFIGPNFGEYQDMINGHFFESRGEAKDWLAKQSLTDYWILIKGSRGMALEKLLEEE